MLACADAAAEANAALPECAANITRAFADLCAEPAAPRPAVQGTVGALWGARLFVNGPASFAAPLAQPFSLARSVGGEVKRKREAESREVARAHRQLSDQRRKLAAQTKTQAKAPTKFRNMDRTQEWEEKRVRKVAHWMDMLCVDGKNSKTDTRIFSGEHVRTAMHLCSAAAAAAQSTTNSRDLQTGTPQLWAILLLQEAVARDCGWTVSTDEAKLMLCFSTLEGIVAQYGGEPTALNEPLPANPPVRKLKGGCTPRVLGSHSLGSGDALEAKIECLDQLLRRSSHNGKGLHPDVKRLKPPAVLRLGKPGSLACLQKRTVQGHAFYGVAQ